MSNPFSHSGLVRLVFLPAYGSWALEQREDSGNPAYHHTLPIPLAMAQALRDQGIPDGNSAGIANMIPVQMDIFS